MNEENNSRYPRTNFDSLIFGTLSLAGSIATTEIVRTISDIFHRHAAFAAMETLPCVLIAAGTVACADWAIRGLPKSLTHYVEEFRDVPSRTYENMPEF